MNNGVVTTSTVNTSTDENGSLRIHSHIKIFDPENNIVVLNKRDS